MKTPSLRALETVRPRDVGPVSRLLGGEDSLAVFLVGQGLPWACPAGRFMLLILGRASPALHLLAVSVWTHQRFRLTAEN
jgi:hypothetical protein